MLKKMVCKIEEMDKKKEFAVITILSFLLVFGVMLLTGTLTCGWHLVDDHDFLKWTYKLKIENVDLVEIIKRVSKREFSYRYTPLYIVMRILICSIFGTNLLYYSLLKGLETWLTCIMLYYCGRQMKADKITSFLFAAMSLVGYQSAVWWRLGTHEIQGTLFFAAGFYLMMKYLAKGKKSYAIFSLIIFLVMCNYKESFILLMPFLMLYVIYFDIQEKGGKVTWALIWEGIRNRFWYLLCQGLIFTVIVLIIVFFVGVNNYDKVGLDAAVPLENYLQALSNALAKDLKWFKRFGILFAAILLTYWDNLKKLWKEMLLIIVFLLPQFIIFGQTGIMERYILPSAMGYALFFVIIVPKEKFLSGKRQVIYFLGIFLLLAAHGRVALREADYFRFRGESVTTMLETVQALSNKDGKVLSCLRPNEEGNLTIYYWMLLHGNDNMYAWTEDDKTIERYYDDTGEDGLGDYDFQDMDIVVMYNEEDRHYCYSPSLDMSGFTLLKSGSLDIYVRDSDKIELPDTTVEGLKINF